MSLFGPSPQVTTSSGQSSTQYIPDPNIQAQWGNITATTGALANNNLNNYYYNSANGIPMVANPTDAMNYYLGSANQLAQAAPDVSQQQNTIGGLGGYESSQAFQSPWSVNMGPSYNMASFQPGATPQFGAVPQVSAPQMAGIQGYSPQQISAPAAYSPQQVSAQQISAPGQVNPITGVQNVNAMGLTNYQMAGVPSVNAPQLNQYSMQAAPNVAPNAQVGTQSWTNPGTAQQYMNPYVQSAVNAQLAQAQVQNTQQINQEQGQAAQQGAFGGTREAVEEANQNLGYQQLASTIEQQGLQSAYSQGMQQFNQEQGLGLQAQTTNVQAGLQAALANQQMQQQAGTQNLASALQTQQLGAQTGLQAQLANQQAGLTTEGQNLSANLQTQQLGATTGLQAALANQSMNYQTQLANQQAQEFGYTQQMQAEQANQQYGYMAQAANQQAGLSAASMNDQYQMMAAQANQQAGLQAGLANNQLQAQMEQAQAGMGMQAGLANQAAGMQAAGMNFSGAEQTQNLGLSGAEYGANLGLNVNQAQQAGMLAQAQSNMNAAQGAAGLFNQQAQLGMQGYNTALGGLTQAAMPAANMQQGYEQAISDASVQQWMWGNTIPMSSEEALAGVTAMQPLPYTMNNQYSGTQTTMPSQPSIFSQGLQGGLGALSAFGAFSDVRLKEDIRPLGGIAGIPMYSYRFKGLPGRMIGPMAQEVYEKWPDVVLPGNDSQPWMIDVPRFVGRLHREAQSGLARPRPVRAPQGLALAA